MENNPTTVHLKDFSEDNLTYCLREWREAAWMQEARQAAFNAYRKSDWPGRHEEEWRRTKIDQLQLEDYAIQFLDAPKLPAVSSRVPEKTAGMLRLGEGLCKENSLAEDLFAKGVIFTTVADAVARNPELVQRYFMKSVAVGEGKLQALHASLATQAVFLYVPPAVTITLPLVAVWEESGPKHMSFPYLLVVLAPGARATLYQQFTSGNPDDVVAVDSLTSIHVEDNAALNYIVGQELNLNSYYFHHGWATLARDASFYSFTGTWGSALTKTRLGSSIEGPGANVEMEGVYFAEEEQHFDQRTIQYHHSGNSRSNTLYKGIAKDTARTVYQGLIRVFPDAQKTDAYQANRNLILNNSARADSIPGLEIEANDLKCTHGTTVGKVNEESLFYLMSRGLSRREATQMIVTGFVEDILAKLPENIAEHCRDLVEKKLESFQED